MMNVTASLDVDKRPRNDTVNATEDARAGDTKATQNGDQVFLPPKEQTIVHCDQCPYKEPLLEMKPGSKRFRMLLHMTLQDSSFSMLARVIEVIVLLLILISTLGLILETLPALRDFGFVFDAIGAVSSIAFTIEYMARLYSLRDRRRYALSAMGLVDLLAVLPFYVDILIQKSDSANAVSVLRIFRVVRLVRLLRVLRLGSFIVYSRIFAETFKRSSDALHLLMYFVMLSVVMFSSLVYSAEAGEFDQASGLYLRSDGKPSPYTSIPAAFWWAVVTMTTVGYGDVVPIETTGKLIGMMAVCSGIFVFALPLAILGANFREAYDEAKRALRQQQNLVNYSKSAGVLLKSHPSRELLYDQGRAMLVTFKQIIDTTDNPEMLTLIYENIEHGLSAAQKHMDRS